MAGPTNGSARGACSRACRFAPAFFTAARISSSLGRCAGSSLSNDSNVERSIPSPALPRAVITMRANVRPCSTRVPSLDTRVLATLSDSTEM